MCLCRLGAVQEGPQAIPELHTLLGQIAQSSWKDTMQMQMEGPPLRALLRTLGLDVLERVYELAAAAQEAGAREAVQVCLLAVWRS